LFRILLFAGFAIVGSVWALVRFYTHVRPPMLVPALPVLPAPMGAPDVDAGARLIPAPEIEVEPR
jgi:hypothetical protein